MEISPSAFSIQISIRIQLTPCLCNTFVSTKLSLLYTRNLFIPVNQESLPNTAHPENNDI